MGEEKVLHWERALLAGDAELLSRRPTGYKEVTREPVPIRESGKWVNRNPHKGDRDGKIWWCERYYVQVVDLGLRDYGTDKSRSRNFMVGTNCRFFKLKFRDGEQEEYEGYGLEFPLTPYYQENDKKEKRPAMRINLGTKRVGNEKRKVQEQTENLKRERVDFSSSCNTNI